MSFIRLALTVLLGCIDTAVVLTGTLLSAGMLARPDQFPAPAWIKIAVWSITLAVLIFHFEFFEWLEYRADHPEDPVRFKTFVFSRKYQEMTG